MQIGGRPVRFFWRAKPAVYGFEVFWDGAFGEGVKPQFTACHATACVGNGRSKHLTFSSENLTYFSQSLTFSSYPPAPINVTSASSGMLYCQRLSEGASIVFVRCSWYESPLGSKIDADRRSAGLFFFWRAKQAVYGFEGFSDGALACAREGVKPQFTAYHATACDGNSRSGNLLFLPEILLFLPKILLFLPRICINTYFLLPIYKYYFLPCKEPMNLTFFFLLHPVHGRVEVFFFFFGKLLTDSPWKWN